MNISVDVDIDDVLWEMSKREKQDLAEELYEAGYIPIEIERKEAQYDDDFSIACKKLMGQAWRLTREEEEFIINISKRF